MRHDDRQVGLSPHHGSDIFRSFMEDFYAMRRALGSRHRDAWQPPTDVYETDSEVVIKMSIPGINPRELAVQINGDVVTICGVRKGPAPGTVVSYHQMEIRNGYFERRILIHVPFDADKAQGEYSDGFAYVRIPKAPEAARRVVTLRISL